MRKLSAETKKRIDRWERRVLPILVLAAFATGAHGYARYQRLQEATERFERGDTAWDHGDMACATDEFTAALRVEPTFFPARDALATIAWQKGHQGECLALLREGVRLQPRSVAAQRALGESYFLMHDFRSAIPPLEAAERLQPEHPRRPSLLETCRRALVDPPRFTSEAGQWTGIRRHATIHPAPCCDHEHEHGAHAEEAHGLTGR
jgi:tetratricopeptide (TPR) repeat protein